MNDENKELKETKLDKEEEIKYFQEDIEKLEENLRS
jgi:hypothetical protein